jgi:hypothetical protein
MLNKLQVHALFTAVLLLPTLVFTAEEANTYPLVFNNSNNSCISETCITSEKLQHKEEEILAAIVFDID